MTDTTRNTVPAGAAILFAVTAIAITVTLALGSTVCATDASASCPNWPGCYFGRLTPLDATQPWVEFIHRVISASVGLFAVASVIVGVAYRRADKLLVVLPVVALLGALTSGVFGMMTIKWGITSVEASFDLLAAIVSMGAMWRAYFVARRPGAPWMWNGRTKLGVGAVVFLVAGHFFAVQVAGPGSLTRCMGWAMFVRGAGDGPLAGWVAQQTVTGIGMLLAIVFLAARWGRRNGWDILCAVLIVIELVVGVLIAAHGSNHGLGTLHAVPAVLILCLTMTATMRSARG
ncbi:cytochrome C oxidase subunit I [Cutibacterium sp. WCA-380-WT-3A]|uniref:Cytochrome C oxidase subunit I n=1 Tax=Cutibacterium porci TaxID=2605781 RepID=A0A7K0J9J8_9ACTN|nr:COX15/CtaA family protein [Cutibacterium porci]MSS46654.1 cytochrome C oxidase subunit I [Cutibacterium porci]